MVAKKKKIASLKKEKFSNSAENRKMLNSDTLTLSVLPWSDT